MTAGLALAIRMSGGVLNNARRYVPRVGDAPEGVQVEEGERGGLYYETGQHETPKAKPTKAKKEAPAHDYGRGHKVMRSGNSWAWGASHSDSYAITGESAEYMGIKGWKRTSDESDMLPKVARDFLTAIATDEIGAEDELYHGFSNTAGTDWKVGDTLKLPLQACSSDPGDAAGYGTRGMYDRLSDGATLEDINKATMFKFAKGTQMVGYSRNSVADQKEYPEYGIWSEAIVAGEYEVTGLSQTTERGWRGIPVKVVELRQIGAFHPTKGWSDLD